MTTYWRRLLSTVCWSDLGAAASRLNPLMACGLFDGLAHEPWRHGVPPVRVMIPGRSGRSQVTSMAAVTSSVAGLISSSQ
jgi:hypothetical protein